MSPIGPISRVSAFASLLALAGVAHAQPRRASAAAPTVSTRAAPTHLALVREDLGADARVLRAVSLPAPNGTAYAATLATYVEDDEASFLIAYGPTDRTLRDEIQTTSFESLAGEHVELTRFEPTLVPVTTADGRPGAYLFVEIATSNDRYLARARICDDSVYSEEEEPDCEYELEEAGGSQLVVIDLATSEIVANTELSELDVGTVGRYRLADDDEDGIPEVVVETYECVAEEPEECSLRSGRGFGRPSTLGWDAAVRALRERGRARGTYLIEVSRETIRLAEGDDARNPR